MTHLFARCAFTLCIVGGCLGLWLTHQSPTNNAFTASNKGHYVLAATLLQRDADKGNLNANTSLANFYKLGLGVAKDARKAVVLYGISAKGGDLSAMINLALMYRDGQGIEKNPTLAYAWLHLAHLSKSTVAQYYMSEMLEKQQLSAQLVPGIRKKYSTLANMPLPEAAG